MVTILAVLVIGGGGAYAALHLARNSVGTKQLKKNAVTGKKVKPHTLTGADINLKKLGTVPAAAHATSADSVPAADTLHLVGSPGEPPFLPGANGAGPGEPFPQVSFYKDREGFVHIEGAAAVTEGSFGGVFTLPPGYRPAAGTELVFPQPSEGAVLVFGSNFTALEGLDPSGIVATTEKFAFLAGISFRAGS
jgi:hypothetical protein